MELLSPVLIPSIPKKISDEKIVHVAQVILWGYLEYSGQWHEIVDLVLASGKLGLQKRNNFFEFYFRFSAFAFIKIRK